MKKNSTFSYSDEGLDLLTLSYFSLFIFGVVLSTLVLSSNLQIVFYLLLTSVFVVFMVLESSIVRRREFSFYLIVPILISATQNIYLGLISPNASSTQIQLMIILNFMISVSICLYVGFMRQNYETKKIVRSPLIFLTSTCIYSIFTVIIFHGNIMSGFASLRNIITPILFYLIGILTCRMTNIDRYLKYIIYITWFVVAFGFYEKFIDPNIWNLFHLTDLWTKKGLPTNPISGLPLNYYSSEKFGGQQIRRMVSSFADPVNLGTFLFFGFMSAWYLKRRFILFLIPITMILTVSKGAILGLFIFFIIWAKNYSSKIIYLISICFTVLLGSGFILYSFTDSTMSLFLHVSGFFSSLLNLPFHPLGMGLGNVGVLAGLYSSGSDSSITETGLGMIIGQLGVIGLVIFIKFFVNISNNIKLIQNKRQRVLTQTISYAIILNIIFNEVALSPNSSAAYFMCLGIICGQWIIRNMNAKLQA